jgi:hypothetical protein
VQVDLAAVAVPQRDGDRQVGAEHGVAVSPQPAHKPVDRPLVDGEIKVGVRPGRLAEQGVYAPSPSIQPTTPSAASRSTTASTCPLSTR